MKKQLIISTLPIGLLLIPNAGECELSKISPFCAASEAGLEAELQFTMSLAGDVTGVARDVGLSVRSEYE